MRTLPASPSPLTIPQRPDCALPRAASPACFIWQASVSTCPSSDDSAASERAHPAVLPPSPCSRCATWRWACHALHADCVRQVARLPGSHAARDGNGLRSTCNLPVSDKSTGPGPAARNTLARKCGWRAAVWFTRAYIRWRHAPVGETRSSPNEPHPSDEPRHAALFHSAQPRGVGSGAQKSPLCARPAPKLPATPWHLYCSPCLTSPA
jgi:hypothetical protein